MLSAFGRFNQQNKGGGGGGGGGKLLSAFARITQWGEAGMYVNFYYKGGGGGGGMALSACMPLGTPMVHGH